MRGRGKRLILAALSLSVLAVFAWTIHTQPPAPATIRPARISAPALPKSETPDLPIAPAVPALPEVTVPAATHPTAAPAPVLPMVSAPKPDAKFAEFRAWTNEAVKPGGKPGDFVARGVTLATERRAALSQMIVEDPERALAEALPAR